MVPSPCADSEEKHEPVSGVDIAVAVSLKVLDLDGRLEKRTSARARRMSANDPFRKLTNLICRDAQRGLYQWGTRAISRASGS